MKKFSIAAVCLFIILSACKTGEVSNKTYEVINGELVGSFSQTALHIAPFSVWYEENFQAFNPDSMELALLAEHLQGIKIQVVMGTWCSDSKRETPRLFKLLSEINFPIEEVTIIGVDKDQFRNNKDSISLIKGLKIVRVPTIIFYKDKKELGRIIEFPVHSLEKDMNLIISGKEYRPNYYEQWQSTQ